MLETRRRARPACDRLESRSLLGGAAPTDLEQLFLQRLNDIRANPAAYGASIGVDLSRVRPAEPLAFNPTLTAFARGELPAVRDTAFNRLSLDRQVRLAGFPANATGNCFVGLGFYSNTDANSLRQATEKMVDETLATMMTFAKKGQLVYRKQLLAISDDRAKPRRQAGIGIVLENRTDFTLVDGQPPVASLFYRSTLTTASDADRRVFITGAAYRDANSNGRYDLGEGLGNVQISVSGSGSASTTTYDTGGYGVRLGRGTYVVTASGGGLPSPIQSTVQVASRNVRLDFVA